MKRIIKEAPEMEKATKRKTSAATSPVSTKDKDGKAKQENWNYSLVCKDPKASHETAVKHGIRFLLTTQERNGGPEPAFGLNTRPDTNRGLETYVDASFAGEWSSANSEEPMSVLSRTGYIIKYANCPIAWTSKLQLKSH
eukprot:13053879-Ditylum_brightwellii.AAC.1